MRAERARSSAWGPAIHCFLIDPINGPLFFINRINGAARLPLFFIDRINGRTSPSRSREAAVRVREVVLAPVRPCYGRATVPRGQRRRQGFRVVLRPLTRSGATADCSPGPVFACSLQGKTGTAAARRRSGRTLPPPPPMTTSTWVISRPRGTAGGTIRTIEKPRTRGRARAARQRAAERARAMQGRGAAMVGLSRALHHRRRGGGAGDRLRARGLPPRDQPSLRRDRRGGGAGELQPRRRGGRDRKSVV